MSQRPSRASLARPPARSERQHSHSRELLPPQQQQQQQGGQASPALVSAGDPPVKAPVLHLSPAIAALAHPSSGGADPSAAASHSAASSRSSLRVSVSGVSSVPPSPSLHGLGNGANTELELSRRAPSQSSTRGSDGRALASKLHTINVAAAKESNTMSSSTGTGPQALRLEEAGGMHGSAAPQSHAAHSTAPPPRAARAATGLGNAGAGDARRDDRTLTLEKGRAHFPTNEKGKQPLWASSTNCVITSKYTLLTFLPINLFEQFSNLANLYFLLVGIFQIIPQFSTTDGNPTMYQPLAFIVFVSACRAAKEDWDKHKADRGRNGFKYQVLRGDRLEETESGEIRVGDVVKVLQNNMIPADMLFLGSSLSKGHCFIDKSNLNGETTLEVMNSMVQTRPHARDEKTLQGLALTLVYEPPNKRFDSFRGDIEMGGDRFAVDGKSLMMRETNLRNCDFVYGLVVYTGNDTKIQRSNLEGEKPKTKVSYIMRQVSTYLVYMLILQSILCLIGGILAGAFRGGFTSDMWFLAFDHSEAGDAPDPVRTGIFAFFSWFILLSQMVPISLIVSSELVKFMQSLFIEQDIQLYYPKLNKTAKCNSSTIHEDLGLIDYIFSDKTGTLTQNKMEFRYLSLTAGEFGSKETDIAKSVKLRQQQLADKQAGRPAQGLTRSWSQLIKPHLAPKDPRIDTRYCCTAGWFSDHCWSSSKPDEVDEEEEAPLAKNEFTEEERRELWQRLYGKPPQGEDRATTEKKRASLRRYMVHMALSNTVKPYEDDGEIKFQAESAEELAMANFSRSCGFFKRQINPTILEITEYDENLKEKPEKVVETYNHVATFGFTSKRARVTVIYQRADGDKTVHAMMKGQDTVALPLLELDDTNEDDLLENLKNMSTFGLRTLVCGYAELDPSWWTKRAQVYQEVIQRDSTAASEGHPEKCDKAKCEKCAQHDTFERMEQEAGFKYLGCMGLEDQLQLLVPECIRDCVTGGIKVWMITGDKLETAKNIGLACNLIDPDMIPSFSSAEIDTVVEEFRRTRLVEITGAWASMSQSDEDLGKIFDVFDKDKGGKLEVEELHYILQALRCNLDEEKLRGIIADNSPRSPPHGQDHNSIDRAGFMHLLKSTQMSRFDAVWFDIEEGIKTYNAIGNHDQFPVSLLIDRAAFQVLFPGKAGATPTSADLAALGPGVTLKKLTKLREMFFQLAGRAKSVVFARAEPAMKKRMVTEIQARVSGAITLAIGDGANDTDMITAAHVGVGIAGVEGTAATNSADYAIGTFRMLHSLLFHHGFWSYHRTSKMVNFIFYKASLVAVMMFIFGFFSAMSGQQFFNDPPYQLYNVMYTALPVLVMAVLDQVLPASFLEDNPRLYHLQKHTAFDAMIFSGWILRSFLHALIIFFIPYAAFGVDNVSQPDGRADGLWYFSTTVYYCTVMTPTLLIMFEMSIITFLHWVAIACSVCALFIVTLIMNYMTSVVPDLNGVVSLMYSTWMFWLVLLLTVGCCMILELIWRSWMREMYPTVVQIFQEIQRMSPEQQKKALDPALLVPPHEKPKSSSGGDHMGSGLSLPPGSAPPAGDDHIPLEHSVSVANFNGDPTARGSVFRRPSIGERHRSAASLTHKPMDAQQRSRDKLKNNMNMTGAQFDSAAQAQLQQHDKFRTFDEQGREILSPNGNSPRGGGSLAPPSASSSMLMHESKQYAPSAAPSPSHFTVGSASSQLGFGGTASALNVEHLLGKYEGSGDQFASAAGSATVHRHAAQQITDSLDDEEPKTDDRRL